MTKYNIKLTHQSGRFDYAVVESSNDDDAIDKAKSITPGDIVKTRIMSRVNNMPKCNLTWIAEDFNF